MFYHVKELQFNARVSGPDPRFATLLLEQFGGGNGEMKAAMQYFVQSFSMRQAYPQHYDLLMDVATEEFSHLEIVGATIQMLLNGINGELKNAAERSDLMKLVGSSNRKENIIHEAMVNPDLLVLTGGGPMPTNAAGVPWTGAYVNANGDPTVDFRSDIAAEGRAKIVYEYLLQFTDDPYVRESLTFLMTREIAHAQMFTAALATIQPNFPPGILQGDPRYTHTYFNMSNGASARGPWNEGRGPWGPGESWEYIEDPVKHVVRSQGLLKHQGKGALSEEDAERIGRNLGDKRSSEISAKVGTGENQWSNYPQTTLESPREVLK